MSVVMMLLFLSSAGGTFAAAKRAEKQQAARDELLNPQAITRLQPLYPDTTVMMERAEILNRYHLSLFREIRPQQKDLN